jgi:hypothetical protein
MKNWLALAVTAGLVATGLTASRGTRQYRVALPNMITDTAAKSNGLPTAAIYTNKLVFTR